MTVLLKVLEKIVQRGVLMVVRRRAANNLFMKKFEVLVGFRGIRSCN